MPNETLYKLTAEELAWRGLIHGTRIQNIAIALKLPSNTHDIEHVMHALVEAGLAKWDHAAPTTSQEFHGMGGMFPRGRRGTANKAWAAELQKHGPGFELAWYLGSTKRATLLDGVPPPASLGVSF